MLLADLWASADCEYTDNFDVLACVCGAFKKIIPNWFSPENTSS